MLPDLLSFSAEINLCFEMLQRKIKPEKAVCPPCRFKLNLTLNLTFFILTVKGKCTSTLGQVHRPGPFHSAQ